MRCTVGRTGLFGMLGVLLLAVSVPAATVDQYPASETTVYGTVTGTFNDVLTSNNVYEAIREVLRPGGSYNYSWMEHRWTFSVQAGTSQQFRVEAYRPSNSDSDNFTFAYSTNGSTWTNMVTVSKTSDDNTDQTYSLPAGTSGTVYVRVVDTNRTKNRASLDYIYVDRMLIRTTYNAAPTVDAGTDQAVTMPAAANLDGTVSDDGLPNPPAAVTVTWSKVSGPGNVSFGNANAVDTTATFDAAGTYVLQLLASDSALQSTDTVTITVGSASTITFINNVLTYGSPSDLGTTIDPPGLYDVQQSYGVSKASFQALNPQVVAFDAAPPPGTPMNSLVAYYTPTGAVTFTFGVPYNYGSYTSYGRGGFSGTAYQDAMSTAPVTNGGLTDWLDATITTTGGQSVRALGFCVCFRNDQAVDAGQAIFTLNDATTETIALPALGGANPQYVFIGYQAPAGKAITRVQASHTAAVGGAWVAVDDWSFVMGTVTDTTAPAAVSNLAAGSATSSSLTLTWTAPGDDNNTGTAGSYDIRYSTSTINDGNWGSATQVTGEPAPQAAGASESMVVSGLNASTTYYFAIKTSDEVPNTSALSNVASGTTGAPTPVVVALKRHGGLTAGGATDARFDSATVRTVTVADAGIYNASNSRWMNAGACDRPANASHMLYKFDLSSIPANSTINLAQLRLYHTGGNGGQGNGDVYVVTTHDWTEGTGTTDMASYPGAAGGVSLAHFNGYNTGPLQDAAGGTTGSLQTWGAGSDSFFDITLDAALPLAPSSLPTGTGYHVIPVTAHVQQWVSGTRPNYGWAQIRGYWDFHCSEAGTALEPVLFVDYTPGGGADTTAPAAVSDLATGSPTSTSITLTWTAPGDDGSTGTASSYDIRYSTSAINEGNWAAATQVTGEPAPQAAGIVQNMVVGGLNSGTTYYFAIKTSDETLNTSAISNSPSGTTSPASGTGTGLRADYYDNSDLTGFVLSRTDATVNFDWGTGSPDAAIGADTFSVRWTGQVQAQYNETYTFYTYSDDGVRLWVNGQLIVNNWSDHSPTENSGTIALAAGVKYDITMEYYENVGGAVATLSWSSPSTAKQVVPQLQLYPAAGDTTAPAAVANLATGSPTGTSITLTWTAPGDDGSAGTASSYDIRYSTSTITDANWGSATQVAGEPTPAAAGTAQNMVVSGLSGDTTYYFAMKTMDEVLNTSALSNVVSGRTSDTVAPAAITNLVASNPTGNSVQLSWTAPGDNGAAGTAASYDIRYSTSAITDANWASASQVTGEPAPQAAGSAESVVVSGLNSDTTYYFAIKASDEVPNASGLSNAASATTPDVTAPAAVSNLAAGTPTTSSLTLTWTAPGDSGSSGTASSYDIRYSTSTINDGNWASATQVTGEPAPAAAGTAQNMIVSGLNANTTYYFAIKTSDEVPNTSALSNVASGTTSAVAQPPVTVLQNGLNISGWRGGTEISATYCFMDNWPNANADGTLAEFSKTDLQTAIDTIQAAYKGWDARVYVSQVDWVTDPIPVNLAPVAAAVDIDTGTLVWGSSNAYNAGGGNWTFNGTTYANFVEAVNAGVAAGRSVVVTGAPWTSAWDTTLPAACWNIIIDVPESLVNTYLDNPSSDGLFVGAQKSDGSVSIFQGDQWAHQANIRVVVQQPPQAAPWIGVNPCVVSKTIALNNPTTTQSVTVTNGGTGTFTWTAAENPDVTWLSLTGASGSPNGQFTMNFNVTGLAVGTYTTKVRVTATGAANTPLDIPVRVQVTPAPDTVAPAAITNLAASNPTDTTVTLTWTAPGDDNNTGTATTYDIRYSTSTINDGNWSGATQVSGEITPAVAGTVQSMVIPGLSATTTYYFAMKTADEQPNWSGLSNVVSATTTTLQQGPVTVKHIGGNTSIWRGGYNISPSYGFLSNWPNSNADAALGEFDRTELQNAINTIYSAYSGWDARIVVSQVNWDTNQPSGGLTMVAGSADLDRGTVVWQNGNAFGAGNGSWTFNGTGYGDFASAINAGTASGETVVVSGVPYSTVWDTSLPAPCWNIVMDVPESLINAYLQNSGALGLFASSTSTTGLVVHGNDQWSHQANIRVVVQRPPQTAPWIGLNMHAINKTIALSAPTGSQVVNVTNAGTGTLSWTAAENPDVSWLTISNGSGTNNGSFTANFNVTGLTAGTTYTTKIRVSASGAGNTPQDVSVSVKVVSNTSPIIQLSPSSLSYDMAPSDAAQGQAVTVNNGGLGSLNWTAAESPDVSWITLSSASGVDGQAFTVTVNPSSLAPGNYSASISVSASGATNTPQTVPVSLLVREKDANITTANGYDDAWESGANGWVQHCTDLKNAWSGKTDGFVVQIGDSITYAAPYGSWARYGSGKTTADANVCTWMHSDVNGDGTNSSTNGWWLAYYDVPGRGGSYTAKSGIRADQYLAGNYSLPSTDQMFTSGYTNPDGRQYRDAEICVLMLGTNDCGANRPAADVAADLGTIIDKMEAAKVIVALSTLPPRYGADATIQAYNTQIRALAQTKKVPLIDYYQEVVRRRPNGSWMGTLISNDGVHPSADYGGSSAGSDPYANNGAALSNSGYLLRDWLSVQKIQEIKTKVITGTTTWNVSTTAQLESAVANYAPGDSIVIATGTYNPTNRLYMDNGAVTVRGATGNRDDVVISGPGMAVNQEPTEMFDIYSDDVTIKDLTIRDVYYHGVHMRGENDVDRTHLQNLHTINCGERHLKGSWNSATPSYIQDDIIIENCLLEQTQANSNHPDNDYIAGIDTMGVNNIIIRDNVFHGIKGPTGGGRAAIFIWHHNTNCTIERNQIYDCDRGISMGNPGWAGPGAASTGGIIRNNMVTRGVNIALELCFTDSMKIYYNSIYSEDAGYWRTVSIYDSSGIYVTNNLQLYYNIIRGAVNNGSAGSSVYLTGNIVGPDAWTTWFVNPAIADLHLTSQATSAFNTGALLGDVPQDFDGQSRSSTPDKGADETAY